MAQTLAERLVIVWARIASIDTILDDLVTCPKPTYTVDAQTFKWTEYYEMLTNARKSLLAEADALTDITEGAGFEATQVYVDG